MLVPVLQAKVRERMRKARAKFLASDASELGGGSGKKAKRRGRSPRSSPRSRSPRAGDASPRQAAGLSRFPSIGSGSQVNLKDGWMLGVGDGAPTSLDLTGVSDVYVEPPSMSDLSELLPQSLSSHLAGSIHAQPTPSRGNSPRSRTTSTAGSVASTGAGGAAELDEALIARRHAALEARRRRIMASRQHQPSPSPTPTGGNASADQALGAGGARAAASPTVVVRAASPIRAAQHPPQVPPTSPIHSPGGAPLASPPPAVPVSQPRTTATATQSDGAEASRLPPLPTASLRRDTAQRRGRGGIEAAGRASPHAGAAHGHRDGVGLSSTRSSLTSTTRSSGSQPRRSPKQPRRLARKGKKGKAKGGKGGKGAKAKKAAQVDAAPVQAVKPPKRKKKSKRKKGRVPGARLYNQAAAATLSFDDHIAIALGLRPPPGLAPPRANTQRSILASAGMDDDSLWDPRAATMPLPSSARSDDSPSPTFNRGRAPYCGPLLTGYGSRTRVLLLLLLCVCMSRAT